MYRENEFSSRRENVDEDILRRMIDGGCSQGDGGARIEAMPEANRKTWGIKGYPLAMVYSPLQDFSELYEGDDALEHGTLFKGLYLPFEATWQGSTNKKCPLSDGGCKGGCSNE